MCLLYKKINLEMTAVNNRVYRKKKLVNSVRKKKRKKSNTNEDKNNERQTLLNAFVFVCYLIDHIRATYNRTSVNANY